jgi:transglutaminase-like putative cysteine protease
VTSVIGFAQEDPSVPLFRAHTALPTYWQVAILTGQANGTWRVPATVAREMRRGDNNADGGTSDPAADATAGSLDADVTIEAYRGDLLPVPIGATQVRSPLATHFVDGAVVQVRPTTSGEHYVVGVAPSDATSSVGVDSSEENTPPRVPTAASIPPEVRRLARGVVARAEDQEEMVQRLVDWFQSGRFHYTTAEQPVPPPGVAPVVAFLTQTKTGNCQTFTDAFAAMAQSLGLPVRVAIGFTSGTPVQGGESLITGADAHTWPQVYLGSSVGWESVEPTPPSIVAVAPPLGLRSVNPALTPTTQPDTFPGGSPHATNPVPAHAPAVGHATTPTAAEASPPTMQAAGRAGSIGSTPWSLLGGALLAILTCGGLLFVARRRTARAHQDPYEVVLEAWNHCARALAKAEFECVASQTHVDLACRLRRAIEGGGVGADPQEPLQADLEQLADDVETVALLETEARYAGWDVGSASASAAALAAGRVRATLRRRVVRRALRDVRMASISPGRENLGTLAATQASTQGGADEARGVLHGADPAGVGR